MFIDPEARIEIRSLPGNGTTASLVFPAHFGIMKEAQ